MVVVVVVMGALLLLLLWAGVARGRGCFERVPARGHLVQADAQTPPVDGGAVALVQEH